MRLAIFPSSLVAQDKDSEKQTEEKVKSLRFLLQAATRVGFIPKKAFFQP